MNNNNKKTISVNKRKHFFLLFLISGTFAITILLAIIFLVKRVNSKSEQNKKETNSETEFTSNLSSEDKNCPYLNESELTTIPENKRYSKLKISDEDLTK